MLTRRFGVCSAMICALGLAGCGDPLDRMERLSEVQLSESDPVREALASPEELERTGGFLGGLFQRAPEQPDDVTVAAQAASDALSADAPEPVDVEVALDGAGTDVVSAKDAPERRGLFGLLRGAAPDPLQAQAAPSDAPDAESPLLETETAVAALPEEIDSPEPETAQAPERRGLFARLARKPEVAQTEAEGVAPAVETAEVVAEPVETVEEVAEVETAAAHEPVAARRNGLLGFLRSDPRPEPEADAEPEAEVDVAALSPEAAPVTSDAVLAAPVAPKETEQEPRRGLFGASRRAAAPKRNGPDAQDVSFGTVLPYGEVARVCSVRPTQMGRRIDKAGRGKGFALYDSAPDSTTPRTFYVTGFSDNCPRQFTAALALFGAPAMHEQLRYGRPSDAYPYSQTDKAYERIKSAICKVGRGKPCGSRIGELERKTVFISTYERFTDNGRWADILLHDGKVLAASLKAP